MKKINFLKFFLKFWMWVKGLFSKKYDKYDPTEKPKPQPAPSEPVPEEPSPPWFGASVYELIQQETELIRAFLKKLKKAGGNATEVFLIHSHNKNTFQPYKYNKQKKQFDLDEWNPAYWFGFRVFLITCKLLGIVPFIRVHDFCSIKRAECNKFYCFMNNIQGFDDVYDEGLYLYYSKLNSRLLNELWNAGIEKYFIIPMSECDGSRSEVDMFNRWYLEDFLNRSIPRNKIIFSADPKHFDRLKILRCKLEVHDIANANDLATAITLYGGNIFGNGDGTRNGNGICSHNKYCEPSPAQAKMLGNYIRHNDLFGYCFKAREAYLTVGEVHPELVKFSALKALVGK